MYAFYSSKSNHVILLGDWNARLGSRLRSDDRLLIGPHTMEGRRNQNGHSMVDFIHEHKLCVLNPCFTSLRVD